MAAKAVSVPGQISEPTTGEIGTDLFLLAIPMETYKRISDAAAQRGMRFSEAIQQAISNWVGASSAPGPKLLTEQKEQS